MKYLIASDIHGSLYYCGKIAEAYEREGASRLILLGDLLYHGPRNPLPKEYDPQGVFELLNGMKEHISCVRGNCDSEVDQMVLEFPMMADYMLLDAQGTPVFTTHGHLYNEECPPPIGRGDILLHGHTHMPAARDTGTFIYLNPGSAALPKEGLAHSYMVYGDGVFIVKSFENKELLRYYIVG
jgi:putative phosphoesterase